VKSFAPQKGTTRMGKTIVITNRKGGTGKSTTAANLGIGLARQNKRVLILDVDSQNSLSISLGVAGSDKLPLTLATMMASIINETDFDPTDGIIHHAEGVDLLPGNNGLARVEIELASLLVGRETVLRQYIATVKLSYDYIIVDTAPTLGLLTVNALVAADSVIIPVTPKFLDAKALESLLKTISRIKRQINPSLQIDGILLTMVEKRANFTREIISLIETAYGGKIHIFGEHIPRSIRAAETSAYGKSIFMHDPKGNAAAAYAALTREVLASA
jgi:chromosome partitioning protein